MQTLTEIRQILDSAGLRPQKRFGQSFLVDQNLLLKLLELSELRGDETVLEVGPATGSLTEELLTRASRVVAVEIDRGLCELLQRRLRGKENFLLIPGDVLAGKHAISPEVLRALGGEAHLVANLPYNIATPLIAESLICSWGALREPSSTGLCRFNRLTFTVQKEVSQRLTGSVGSGSYGPVSVLVALMGKVRLGPPVPASAFWPRPNVTSRIVRIDFNPRGARSIADIDALTKVLRMAFAHRRKQILSIIRTKYPKIAPEALVDALRTVGIDPMWRPEDISPEGFIALANYLREDE